MTACRSPPCGASPRAARGSRGARCKRAGWGRAGVIERGTRAARASRRAPTADRRRRGRAARLALAASSLEEVLDDRPPHRRHLLRVALDGVDQRRVLEVEVEQLPEEVGDVADLAILEHGRELGAHLRLRGLGVHALDDPEARAQHPREHFVGRARAAGSAPKDTRGQVPLSRAYEKVPNETGLSDACRSDDRDGASQLLSAARA